MSPNDIEVQDKKAVDEQEEKTEIGRFYVPYTDIHETADSLFVTMDMPGVARENVDIKLEKNVLTITGRVDFSNYEALKPLYTEYNVGHFTRRFTVSSEIDKDAIAAQIVDGVLAVRLPKVKEEMTKRIEVQ